MVDDISATLSATALLAKTNSVMSLTCISADTCTGLGLFFTPLGGFGNFGDSSGSNQLKRMKQRNKIIFKAIFKCRAYTAKNK